MSPRLTLDDARNLAFEELSVRAYSLLEPFEAPEMETPDERDARIGRTLDRLPDLYAWFLQAHAYFDHWTEFWAGQAGTGAKNTDYKSFRIKRDLMENVARAAKLRYDGASRRITQLGQHQEESRMPRGR